MESHFSLPSSIGRVLDTAHLASEVVLKIPDKWKELARKLKFGRDISSIEEESDYLESHCFAALFKRWRKRGRPNFNWETLTGGLEAIGEVELAKRLRKEYTGGNAPPNKPLGQSSYYYMHIWMMLPFN